MADEDKRNEKKERVIHTRVSETLEQELKQAAGALGVSVSNLVRNILLNTTGLVEGIVADGASVARAARGQAAGERPQEESHAEARPEPVILGWQELILNLNAVCDRCNAILPRGTKAWAAVQDRPGRREIRCLACIEALRSTPGGSGAGEGRSG
jgi:hypothetical protein